MSELTGNNGHDGTPGIDGIEEPQTEQLNTNTEQESPIFEITNRGEGESFEQNFLLSLIEAYEDAFNRNNDKQVIKFRVTTSTHKLPREDGNKDVGLLAIERLTRPKEAEEDWTSMLVHKELHWFKSIKERLNTRWKQQLYLNAITRLVGAGLEYAELLKRMKMVEEGKKKAAELNEQKLTITNQMPVPLTKEDEDYKEWLKKERLKEGIKD